MWIVRSINRLPEGGKVLLEELSVEPDVWIAINLEVEQTFAKRTPKWRKLLINVGTLGAFLAALGAAMLYGLPGWVGGPAAALIIVCWIATIRWLQASSLRSIRWEVMAERGLPICAGCGYNLTALQSPQCPECGRVAGEGGSGEPRRRCPVESD